MKSKLFLLILLSFQVANAEDGCPGKMSHVCNTAGNRWGVCMVKANDSWIVVVPKYSGARWGYSDAPVLIPSGSPGEWILPKPQGRDWENYEKQFRFRILDGGKRAELSHVTQLYPGHMSGRWTENLGACPESYAVPKFTSFYE